MVFGITPYGEACPPVIKIDGTDVPVLFKFNARARRFILRLNTRGEGVSLTMPPGTSRREALDFAISQTAWIAARMKQALEPIDFADGNEIPVRGLAHRIKHLPGVRGTVWSEPAHSSGGPSFLCVSARPEHVERRLRDWLKRQARRDLVEVCTGYARTMGLRHGRISIRDQSSRWGSCSSTGSLSFSWRLILAPPRILDYVGAHEVAHLAEMNHGPRFRALLEAHCAHSKTSRRWLRKYGPDLHRYGRNTKDR